MAESSISWKQVLKVPLLFVLAVCLVSIPDLLGLVEWKQYALRPRVWSQWYGIFTAPFLHGSWEHLWSNLPPLFFLSLGIRLFYPTISTQVFLTSFIAPGLWAFFAARSSLHLGASGVVYALAFFMFFSGVFRRDRRALAVALAVAFYYGSMVWGILPAQPGVSWESHLFGGLAGVILAWYYRKKDKPPKKFDWEDEEDRPNDTGPWDYRRWLVPPEGFQHPEGEA